MHQYDFTCNPEDLDLDLCLFSGQVFRWEKLGEKCWIGVDGATWFTIAETGLGRYGVESNASEAVFRNLFRMGENVSLAKAEIAKCDHRLAPIMESLSGLRMMQPASPHETLFCFLCSANNHLSRIGSMVRKLAAFGEPLAQVDDRLLYRFPNVQRIAAISEEELRGQGFGYRGRTIPMVAKSILDRGDGWFQALGSQPYDSVRAELNALYSIGPKLADCVALYGFDKQMAAPIDTHLWQAIGRMYKPEWKGMALTDKRYREGGDLLRERFGGLAGLAHLFLYFGNQRGVLV